MATAAARAAGMRPVETFRGVRPYAWWTGSRGRPAELVHAEGGAAPAQIGLARDHRLYAEPGADRRMLAVFSGVWSPAEAKRVHTDLAEKAVGLPVFEAAALWGGSIFENDGKVAVLSMARLDGASVADLVTLGQYSVAHHVAVLGLSVRLKQAGLVPSHPRRLDTIWVGRTAEHDELRAFLLGDTVSPNERKPWLRHHYEWRWQSQYVGGRSTRWLTVGDFLELASRPRVRDAALMSE